MPRKHSAGLLLFRELAGDFEVLLVHPGGPFWANKDDGAWSIPKGEAEEGEDLLEAAKREFTEETGTALSAGDFVPLDPVRQPSGKIVHAWAVRGDFDVATLRSNVFALEWPTKSGRQAEFAEVDRAAWFSIKTAKQKLIKGQRPILNQFEARFGQR